MERPDPNQYIIVTGNKDREQLIVAALSRKQAQTACCVLLDHVNELELAISDLSLMRLNLKDELARLVPMPLPKPRKKAAKKKARKKK